jgi:hypothetical protein
MRAAPSYCRCNGSGGMNSLRTGKITAKSGVFVPIPSEQTSNCPQVLRFIGNSLLKQNRDFDFRNRECAGSSRELANRSPLDFRGIVSPPSARLQKANASTPRDLGKSRPGRQPRASGPLRRRGFRKSTADELRQLFRIARRPGTAAGAVMAARVGVRDRGRHGRPHRNQADGESEARCLL